MNIFPSSDSAFESARALDDKRIVRQASEVVVLLGNVGALIGFPSPYKPHPQPANELVKWLLVPENWRWTAEYAHACNLIYRDTYGRECVCLPKLRRLRSAHIHHYRYHENKFLLAARPSSFPNLASNASLGLNFRHITNPHEAYRQYLNARWASDKLQPTWRGRTPPEWYKPG